MVDQLLDCLIPVLVLIVISFVLTKAREGIIGFFRPTKTFKVPTITAEEAQKRYDALPPEEKQRLKEEARRRTEAELRGDYDDDDDDEFSYGDYRDDMDPWEIGAAEWQQRNPRRDWPSHMGGPKDDD